MISGLAMLLLMAVVILAAVAKRRSNRANDARGQLDWSTQQWLEARVERSQGVPSHPENGVQYVDAVEHHPAGTERVGEAFRYRAPGRHVTVAVVPAGCGPLRIVAMSQVPEFAGRRYEPGFEMVPQRLCPPGWSMMVPAGTIDHQIVSSPVPAALARLTPDEGGAPAGTELDQQTLAAVRFCLGSLRIDFDGDRAYVLHTSARSGRAKLVADGVGLLLPSRPPAG